MGLDIYFYEEKVNSLKYKKTQLGYFRKFYELHDMMCELFYDEDNDLDYMDFKRIYLDECIISHMYNLATDGLNDLDPSTAYYEEEAYAYKYLRDLCMIIRASLLEGNKVYYIAA